jgi:hypothetical protein
MTAGHIRVGDLTFPAALVDGVEREAEVAAEAFCKVLNEKKEAAPRGEPERDRTAKPLPLALALQVAAALRLEQWERAGLREHLRADLPSARSGLNRALADLRAMRAQREAVSAVTPLTRLYFATWVEGFAWSARTELRADVVLANADALDDAALALLADFLWEHRQALGGDRRIDDECA